MVSGEHGILLNLGNDSIAIFALFSDGFTTELRFFKYIQNLTTR